MIQKVVRKANLREFSEIEDNLAYWLSKTPEERLSAVEILRKQRHGDSERFKELFAFTTYGVEG